LQDFLFLPKPISMNTRQTQLKASERLLDIMDDLRENALKKKANHADVKASYYRRNL
jgi:hypothetical protein